MSVDFCAGIAYGVVIEDDDYQTIIDSLSVEDMLALGMSIEDVKYCFDITFDAFTGNGYTYKNDESEQDWFDNKFEWLHDNDLLFNCDAYVDKDWILGTPIVSVECGEAFAFDSAAVVVPDSIRTRVDKVVRTAYGDARKPSIILYGRVW